MEHYVFALPSQRLDEMREQSDATAAALNTLLALAIEAVRLELSCQAEHAALCRCGHDGMVSFIAVIERRG